MESLASGFWMHIFEFRWGLTKLYNRYKPSFAVYNIKLFLFKSLFSKKFVKPKICIYTSEFYNVRGGVHINCRDT